MSHWHITPWADQDAGTQLRTLLRDRGPVVRCVAFVVIARVALLAFAGYLLCVVLFPTAMLKVGLDLINGPPGVGWFLWAAIVLGFYSLMFVAVVMNAIKLVRAKVVPIANLLHPLLFMAGYGLAAWFIPAYLAG